MNLSKEVIIITGGSGFLGSKFCERVTEKDCICIVADSNFNAAKEIAYKLNLRFNDERAIAFLLDFTVKESVISLINHLDKKFGRIDALVNCAYPKNKNYGRSFFEVNYEDFLENTSMHIGGYFLAAQLFSDYFRSQGYGNIINVASVYGFIAPDFDIYKGTKMTMPVEYTFIKAGILNFTKYLAKYFKGMNIRVNSISPGGLKDNQPKSFQKSYNRNCLNKGMLDPEDIAGALMFLLSKDSEHINGQNIIVDDGFSL